MHTFSRLKQVASALQSKRLSRASKSAPSSCPKPGWTQGGHTRPPCPAMSARKNAPWLHNSASTIAGKAAHLTGGSASPANLKLGTKKPILGTSEEQLSYFSADLAVRQNNILIAHAGLSGPQQSRGRHVRSGS